MSSATQNWTQTINATEAGADLSSAEAIVEAPSSTGSSGSSSVLPLTNFGSVGFTGVTVNGTSMDTLDPVQITMPDTSVSDMASDGKLLRELHGDRLHAVGRLLGNWPPPAARRQQ